MQSQRSFKSGKIAFITFLCLVGITLIVGGDAVGYFLKVSNLIELFFDKKQRFDMRNCNNIVKHKYYDKAPAVFRYA